MNKLLLPVLLLLAAVSLSAQSSHWTFGAKFQASLVFPTFQADNNPSLEASVCEVQLPRFAPGGSLTVDYRVAPRVFLQSGLGLWLSGYRIKEQDLIITTPDLPEGMYKGTFEAKRNYLDMTVPLYIKIHPKADWPRFYLIGGFAAMYKLSRKQTIYFHYLDETDEAFKEVIDAEYQELKALNLRTDFGFGLALPGNKKMNWFLEPMFGYQLFPIIQDGDNQWGQYFLGINLGVTMGR